VAPAAVNRIAEVKVFSATKARDRESLGERVTTWLQAHPHADVLSAAIRLSSDREFHCLSIVLICAHHLVRDSAIEVAPQSA
jgi:hypothetical protein